MTLEPRSWLFIPGDSEKKLAKADGSGADAVILDLEDAVAPDRKDAARALTAAFLAGRRARALDSVPDGAAPSSPRLWVRINPLDGDLWRADLAAIAGQGADGYVLPKCQGAGDVRRLAAALEELSPGDPARILPVATETPRAVFALGSYANAPDPRLAGLCWGAEDLAAAIGAAGNRWPDGRFHESFRMVRALTLFGAHAAGVQAIDTLYADFRDLDGLRRDSEASAQEGFTGRLAIHPAQVPVINAAYRPSAAALDRAQAIVAAFAAQPGVGAIGLDGAMVDRPHLLLAERLIARAAALGIAPS